MVVLNLTPKRFGSRDEQSGKLTPRFWGSIFLRELIN